MMKKDKQKYIFPLLALLTGISALLYSSCRVSYYFIDKSSFRGASVSLLILLIAGIVAELVALVLFQKLGNGVRKAVLIAGVVILLLGITVNIVYAVMGWEMWYDFAYYIKKSLPYFLLICFAVAALLIVPQLKEKAAVSLGLLIVFVFGIATVGFKVQVFRFLANPCVFVGGEEQYSVVWATSDTSTGKVEIKKDDITYTFYDENAGNLRTADKVHHVAVDMDILNGCDYYTVVSQQVKERTGYSLWAGKTLTSEQYRFQAPEATARQLNIWALSDWHEHASLVREAVVSFPKPDLLIMGGDALNEVDDQDAVITHLLAPCAAFSGSKAPVIFAKGNHECRGNYATQLQTDLGLESFYYTYRVGPLSGVVLDMGECYGDEFEEYLSLADYEAYRDKQESWLKNVSVPQAQYTLCICHDELFEAGEQGRISRASLAQSLGEKGTQLLVAGHLHESIYRPAGENGRLFHTFVDGGIEKDKSFSAGLITIDADRVTLSTVNSNGDTRMQESFEIE